MRPIRNDGHGVRGPPGSELITAGLRTRCARPRHWAPSRYVEWPPRRPDTNTTQRRPHDGIFSSYRQQGTTVSGVEIFMLCCGGLRSLLGRDARQRSRARRSRPRQSGQRGGAQSLLLGRDTPNRFPVKAGCARSDKHGGAGGRASHCREVHPDPEDDPPAGASRASADRHRAQRARAAAGGAWPGHGDSPAMAPATAVMVQQPSAVRPTRRYTELATRWLDPLPLTDDAVEAGDVLCCLKPRPGWPDHSVKRPGDQRRRSTIMRTRTVSGFLVQGLSDADQLAAKWIPTPLAHRPISPRLARARSQPRPCRPGDGRVR